MSEWAITTKCSDLQGQAEYRMLWEPLSWTWQHGHGAVRNDSGMRPWNLQAEWELTRWSRGRLRGARAKSLLCLSMAPSSGGWEAGSSRAVLERNQRTPGTIIKKVGAGGWLASYAKGSGLYSNKMQSLWSCLIWLHFRDWIGEAQCWRKEHQWRHFCPNSDKYS